MNFSKSIAFCKSPLIFNLPDMYADVALSCPENKSSTSFESIINVASGLIPPSPLPQLPLPGILQSY